MKEITPIWYSDLKDKVREDEMTLINERLSCFCNGNSDDFALKVFPLLPADMCEQSRYRATQVTSGEDYDGNKYLVLIQFKNEWINQGLLDENTNPEDFNGEYHKYPKWASIDRKQNEEDELFFCIHYENCCPNWNNKSIVTYSIRLSEIDEPIISSLDGIRWVDANIIKAIISPLRKKIGEEFPDYGSQPTKEQLKEMINLGMGCFYRIGWAYRGAESKVISAAKALELLPKYEYGKGFYNLNYCVKDKVPTLVFNELSELDME